MFLYCCCYLMFLCVLVKSRHAQSRAIEVMLNETGMKATDLQYIYIYIYIHTYSIVQAPKSRVIFSSQ